MEVDKFTKTLCDVLSMESPDTVLKLFKEAGIIVNPATDGIMDTIKKVRSLT